MGQEYHKKTQDVVARIAANIVGNGGRGDKLDPNIIVLIDALHKIPGIWTNWSCGGHPEDKRFPYVTFTFDDKAQGLENMAIISAAVDELGWILSCCGRFRWDGRGGYYENEFELYPKKVISLNGAVRGASKEASSSDVLAEQDRITLIADKIDALRCSGKKSFLQAPNTIP